MVFSFFRNHRRQEILAQPFPDAWRNYLQTNVPHYQFLTEDEQRKLRDDLRIFLAEKNWEGCGGQEITEEIQVTISAQACLLLLNIEHDYFKNVESVLVYPTGYQGRDRVADASGVVDEAPAQLLGEAWRQGPVILSWADAYTGGRDFKDGRNVVLHEFAHKLDLKDGRVDGVPELDTDQQVEQWAEVMSAEYQHLVEQSEKGEATLLDHYGATNAGEFFAVTTECFFEKPRQMLHKHARLYEVFRNFYRQDPAARLAGQAEQGSETTEDPEALSGEALIESLTHHHKGTH